MKSIESYVTVTQYNAAGQKERESYGTGTHGMSTPLYLKLHYNRRHQMVDLRLGSSSSEWDYDRGALIFYYGSGGVTNWNPFQDDTDNNGNVLRQVNYVPKTGGGEVIPQLDDYTYDSLNRISGMTEWQYDASGNWQSNVVTQSFTYDRYGNRCVSSATGGVSNSCPTYTASTNRVSSGLTYDASGNITYDAATGGTMAYDAENRMVTASSGGTYTYDGEGKRVKRVAGGQTWWYVYGFGGELLAEYLSGAPTTVKKEYGYRAGQLLLVWDGDKSGDEQWKWLVQDHLGSTRMEADKSGSLAAMKRHDYAPFGEEMAAGIRQSGGVGQYGYEPPQTNVRQKFGSKERDGETGLDYFGARYHSSVQGRFISCDPAGVTKRHILNPQKWNLYIYVLNNPIGFTDPNGRTEQGTGGSRVIDVFLNFSPSERNTTKQGNKETRDSGPDWKKLQSDAKKNGYELRVFDKGQSSINEVRSSLMNSGVTVIVGHSQGVNLLDSGRFEGRWVDVRGAAITPDGVVPGHRYKDTGAFNAIGPTEPRPDVNAQATCLFVCHSIDVLPGAFNFNGSNQAFVGTYGGLTRVGTLENAAFAFVETYVNNQGNLDASVNAAQKAVDESSGDIDKGDKVKLKKVP